MSVWLVGLASLAACDDGPDPAPPPPPCVGVAVEEQGACLTSYYFQGYEPQGWAACKGFVGSTEKIGRTQALSLFLGGQTIEHADLQVEGRFLQRYYEPYELTLTTATAAVPSGLAYAVTGTEAEVDAATKKVVAEYGSTQGAAAEAALDAAITEVLFGPLRRFVASRSNPPSDVIDVVVLDSICSPYAAASLFSRGVLAGLGLSPKLFRSVAAGDPSKNLFTLLGLPPEFTPILLVGHRDIVKLAKMPDVVVAHELGHSLGLQHTTTVGDLMTQGGGDRLCVPGLSDEEVEKLRDTGFTLEGACGWQRVFDLRDDLVRQARRPR
jgi:hypothetical protein